MPNTSVVIPTYNRRAYTLEAIDSVLGQTPGDCEIIVVDDGSDDGTGEALTARYGDRIHYVWQENQGESVARNVAIGLARGGYIAFLDSDDLWLPSRLARQVEVLERDSAVGLVHSQAWVIDAGGHRLPVPPFSSSGPVGGIDLEQLCLKNAIVNSTVLVRSQALLAAGGFDPSIRFAEDWDLWLRIRRDWRFVKVHEPLACMRVHAGSQDLAGGLERTEARLRDHLTVLEKTFKEWPGTVPEGLRNHAVANARARAGVADCVAGRTASGLEQLDRAARLDPVRWPTERDATQALDKAATRVARLGIIPVDLAAQHLSDAYSAMAGRMDDVDARAAAALGELYLRNARDAFVQRRYARAAGLMAKALRHDRSLWIRSIGALKRGGS